jgi:hypothetical protein
MRIAIHSFVIVAILVASGWSLVIFGEVFYHHTYFFLYIWILIPVVALWLGTTFVRSELTVPKLVLLRAALIGSILAIEFVAIAYYSKVRHEIGTTFVPGYYEYYGDTTDANGETHRILKGTTTGTMSSIGLWILQACFVGACVIVPAVTWYGANRAVDKKTQDVTRSAA